MTDRYLKGVLTVIAGALVWIAVQLTVGTAKAAPITEPGIRQVSIVWPETVSFVGRDVQTDLPHRDQVYVPVWCANCK